MMIVFTKVLIPSSLCDLVQRPNDDTFTLLLNDECILGWMDERRRPRIGVKLPESPLPNKLVTIP